MINIPEDKLDLTKNGLARAHASSNVARMLYQSDRGNGSIVNFSFYAMLYAVFALLTPYDVEKGVDKDHIAIDLFDDKFINANIIPKDLSKKIHDAYDLRQAYDFQPSFVISKEQTTETLNSSNEFVNFIEERLK